MKKLFRWTVLWAAAVLLLLAAACGGEKQTASLTAEEAFPTLLGQDYEAAYLLTNLGMTIDSTAGVDVDGALYYPAVSEKYKTTADLRALLESTYADSATVDRLMATTDQKGNPLFRDIDGKLYQSAQGTATSQWLEPDLDNIQVQENGDQATAVVQETGLDGFLYECTVTAVRSEDGQWRLTAPRSEAPRKKVGDVLTGEEDQQPQVSSSQVRQMAENFLMALKAGDTQTIEELAGAQPGTYQGWSALEISKAELNETLEEYETGGTYRVALTVDNGVGLLPEGEQIWELWIRCDENLQLKVERFQQGDPAPYRHMEHSAGEQVSRMLSYFGGPDFQDPSQLDDNIITEYCLQVLAEENGFQDSGFTLEQVQQAVYRYFGLENYDPSGTSFYRPETDDYMAYGRGGIEMPEYNLYLTQGDEGKVEVRLYTYQDPLCTRRDKMQLWTLSDNGNGTYEFLSAVTGEPDGGEQQSAQPDTGEEPENQE